MNGRKPTIAELEAILDSPEGKNIQINPDGSITTKNNEIVTIDGEKDDSKLFLESCLRIIETAEAKQATATAVLQDLHLVLSNFIGRKELNIGNGERTEETKPDAT